VVQDILLEWGQVSTAEGSMTLDSQARGRAKAAPNRDSKNPPPGREWEGSSKINQKAQALELVG